MRKLVRFLNTILICVSILSCYYMPLQAASYNPLKKIVDMALNQTGVVLNDVYLDRVAYSLQEKLNTISDSYYAYCSNNNLALSLDSWNQYLQSAEYSAVGFTLPDWVLRSNYWLNLIMQHISVLSYHDVANIILDTQEIQNDSVYNIPSDAVVSIRKEFDELIQDVDIGYYYINTKPATSIDANWFKNKEIYDSCVRYIQSCSDFSFFLMSSSGSEMTLYEPCSANIIHDGIRGNEVLLYDDNWEQLSLHYRRRMISGSYYFDFDFQQANLFYETNTTTVRATSIAGFNGAGGTNMLFPFTSDGRRVIVYKTLADFKSYSGYNKPYYTTNSVYNETNDNSVEFTGDYFLEYGDTTSYSQVQEYLINNNITNDNSVVNNTTEQITNIVNNYYYDGTSSGSGDGGGSGSGSGSGDGVESFFNGLLSLLDFILELLGKVVEAVSKLLSGVLSLLTTLTESFSGFTGLLGGMFSFLPQELMDILSLGITAIVTIGIIKAIKG